MGAKIQVVSNLADGLAQCRVFGFPVTIKSEYALGGWFVASTEDEARAKIQEGLNLSPTGRTELSWK